MYRVKLNALKTARALSRAIKNLFVPPSAVAAPAYVYSRRQRIAAQRRATRGGQGQ
jgi:hypothetical protein